jgi:hypothetical protein
MVLLICRWRDVKMRALDNAKHRTYVDLKVMSLLATFIKYLHYNTILMRFTYTAV